MKNILALNVFKQCTWCLKHIGKTTMVGMVFFLICVANYAVWRHVLIPGMGDVNILTQLGYAIMSFMYGSCVAMLVWCYIRTVLDSPGEVPAAWYPFEDESQSSICNMMMDIGNRCWKDMSRHWSRPHQRMDPNFSWHTCMLLDQGGARNAGNGSLLGRITAP
eukprot:jgi/Picre1/35060/NNA_002525.t1